MSSVPRDDELGSPPQPPAGHLARTLAHFPRAGTVAQKHNLHWRPCLQIIPLLWIPPVFRDSSCFSASTRYGHQAHQVLRQSSFEMRLLTALRALEAQKNHLRDARGERQEHYSYALWIARYVFV